jgi:hypothetical protein
MYLVGYVMSAIMVTVGEMSTSNTYYYFTLIFRMIDFYIDHM